MGFGRYCIFILPFLLFASPFAQAAGEKVQAEILSEALEVRPGDSFRVGVKLTIADGWHIYGEDPGESGLPTELTWNLPEGVTAGPVQYPPTVPFEFLGEKGQGYQNEVILWSLIEVSQDFEGPIPLAAEASWLVCLDVCMPGSIALNKEIPTASATVRDEELAAVFGSMEQQQSQPPAAPPTAATATAEEGRSLPYLLLLGLLGGMILNLMPCVFPILGLKIMGFVQQAGQERGKIIGHGLVFTAGVLVSFWLLAGILIALRAGGQELGWGFQLQEPGFVLVLTVILLIFGLNMSGVFEIGLSAVGAGNQLTAKSGLGGSFFSGALATVVATPCAAPFLAPALGGALALPALESIAVFTAIALGLALPYLTLSAFPSLIEKLPRPGAWMESLKQFLAFLLYATVVYFLWVLAGQVGPELLLVVLFALVAVGMACWIYGRWSAFHRPTRTRMIARVLALLLLAAPLGYAWSGMVEEERQRDLALQIAEGNAVQDFLIWEPWSLEREEALRADGRLVYIDFTARWCATCQFNKRAYEDSAVVEALLKNNVALLKADWTKQDPAITRALAKFDRRAVPFNLIYSPGKSEPYILPEIFGSGTVLEAIKQAGGSL